MPSSGMISGRREETYRGSRIIGGSDLACSFEKTAAVDRAWPRILCFRRYAIWYGIDAGEFQIGRHSRLPNKLEEES